MKRTIALQKNFSATHVLRESERITVTHNWTEVIFMAAKKKAAKKKTVKKAAPKRKAAPKKKKTVKKAKKR
ncbi:MAG: hypothetical protein WC052_01965 [Patescibacteria group bacterium]